MSNVTKAPCGHFHSSATGRPIGHDCALGLADLKGTKAHATPTAPAPVAREPNPVPAERVRPVRQNPVNLSESFRGGYDPTLPRGPLPRTIQSPEGGVLITPEERYHKATIDFGDRGFDASGSPFLANPVDREAMRRARGGQDGRGDREGRVASRYSNPHVVTRDDNDTFDHDPDSGSERGWSEMHRGGGSSSFYTRRGPSLEQSAPRAPGVTREEMRRAANPVESCGCSHSGSSNSNSDVPLHMRPISAENRCSLLKARYVGNPDNELPAPSCDVLEEMLGPQLDRQLDDARAEIESRLQRAANPVAASAIDRGRSMPRPPGLPNRPQARSNNPVPAAAVVSAPEPHPAVVAGAAASVGAASAPADTRNAAWRLKCITLPPKLLPFIAALNATPSSHLGALNKNASRKVSLSLIDGALEDIKAMEKKAWSSPQQKKDAQVVRNDLQAIRANWRHYAKNTTSGAMDERDYGIADERKIKV